MLILAMPQSKQLFSMDILALPKLLFVIIAMSACDPKSCLLSPVKPMKVLTHGFTSSVSPDHDSDFPFFVNGEMCQGNLFIPTPFPNS